MKKVTLKSQENVEKVPYTGGWLGKYKYHLKTPDDDVVKELNEKLMLPDEYKSDFISGSSYEGTWSKINMEGYGTYVFPHGVIYEGEMRDGEFHGNGKLIYPQGQIMSGKFKKGTMVSWKFENINKKTYDLKSYCKFPDRRFKCTLESDLLPPGEERITEIQPTRIIPRDHYDVGDGFYNPKTKWIYDSEKYHNKGIFKFVRTPVEKLKPINVSNYLPDGKRFIEKIPFVPIYLDEESIKNCCRHEWEQPVGYQKELHEAWMSGRKKEHDRLQSNLKRLGEKQEKSNCMKMIEFFEQIFMEKNDDEDETN